MLKRMILFLFIFAMPVLVSAQQLVSGKVYDLADKKTTLPNVTVRNLNSGKSTVTLGQGNFLIAAKINDLLEFSFVGYHTDTLYLINLSPRTVYLPANSTALKEVEVVGVKINPLIFGPDAETKEYKQFENDALRGKKNNDKAGGLKFNLGYGKYRKTQEKLKAYEERDLYEAEINKVFTAEYVNSITKLKGEELKDFMTLYRPSALLVQGQRPFNYDYYTAKAYHTWLKLPADQRKLQPIPKLTGN